MREGPPRRGGGREWEDLDGGGDGHFIFERAH
jgi:hypothetical protein